MDQSLNWIENFEIKQIQVVCFKLFVFINVKNNTFERIFVILQ